MTAPHLPPDEDLYAVLGVPPSADARAIRAAWRARVKDSHPDVAHDRLAGERMRQVNLAWEWLGTPDRRRRYDLFRLARADLARGGPGRRGADAAGSWDAGGAARTWGAPADSSDAAEAWDGDGAGAGSAERAGATGRSRARSRRVAIVGAGIGLLVLIAGIAGVGLLNGHRDAGRSGPTSVARATTLVRTQPPLGGAESAGPGSSGSEATASPSADAIAGFPATAGPTATTGASPAAGASESPAGASGSPFASFPPGASDSPIGSLPAIPTVPPSLTGYSTRPLAMPVWDAPPECQSLANAALRLDGDVDSDGITDSIFFLGPCPDLSSSNAPDRVLGPFIYASGGSGNGGGAGDGGGAGAGPGPTPSSASLGRATGASPTWHLLKGAGPIAAGWVTRSGFVGQVIPAQAGTSDLGIELVTTDGRTSALAVYRVSGGQVRGLWDSLRDGHVWRDAVFSYAPTPAGAAPNDGALLLVDSGPPGGRIREVWRWVVADGVLTIDLRQTGPVPTP